ncbi:serine hydrolase [Elizabethkingia meningoseptica]|uniref:Serine hydrolase n=1 Tax=Elizabethkingia meningoseptica TaxID=238 RepID=A0A1V3U5D4_ELIME|nr:MULTISPECIES: serine hydrolase [Elizabethkingia]AQX11183.1 serine hydrolase [Elizabethkingia meningoseptica]MBG0512521.1 serine hydrolase [Elizabethkingia meningoseptica]MDE5435123.1 serine hydrolase [Elizabethkingia meningoseptica]MDE5450288.1 serine hydrolase [Elizabethkingia meningoseptica]MDE5472231.1 serine hydrolase [Elizabethkingia meningoseptica]
MKNKISLFFLSVSFAFVNAQVPEVKLDDLVKNTLKTFDVPGMSVGIVKDGKLIYAKGFGVRSLNTKTAMDENTLVGIASNSKGFTATALAILADEGKLNWNDKVTKFIPEFQMYDPYVSQQVTVKDLITHRAGLGLGQGDLMFFPEGGNLTVNDIVHNVRYLKPANPFRTKLDYNNIMFIVAGEVIHRVSGLSWADFIEQRIMKPVGMNNSYGSYNRAKAVANKIDAHAPVDGKAIAVPHDWNETANAAGGIMSNIGDMTTWANFLMNGFVTKDGKRLVSEKNAHELWSLQIPDAVAAKNPYDTHFYGYGMGWFLSDVKGHLQVQHTGGLIGTVTQFTLIPDMKLGIVVLTNQQSGAAFNTITNTVKDSYLGVADRDWLKTYGDRMAKVNASYDKEKKEVFAKVETARKNIQHLAKPEQFTGTYNDTWFGDVVIKKEGTKYLISCVNSPRLKGELLPYSYNTFVAKWDDRSYDADAYIIFNFDENGKAQSAKMKPVSGVTDFSFDFEDLDLKRK